MSGETLGAAFVPNNLTITASGCNPNGNSWFTYTMSGSASGPYTGTFTETGIVDLSAETQTFPVGTAPGPAGSVVGALAHFTINASNGTVQGLSYAPPARGLYDTPGNNFADCLPAGGVTRSPAQHIYEAGANINYAATIQPAGSRSWYVDNGTSNLLIDEENGFVYPTGPGTITQDFAVRGLHVERVLDHPALERFCQFKTTSRSQRAGSLISDPALFVFRRSKVCVSA